MSIMTSNDYQNIIAEAESCFLRGKTGTFAVVRTPDGKLWYAAPGVQTAVNLLRLRICERTFDERSFAGILIIRANRKKGQYWFVFYNPDDKNASYNASSSDEHLDCDFSIVAAAPANPSGNSEAIVVQAVFKSYGKMVSRIQSNDVAQVVLLQAHAVNVDDCREKSSPVVTDSNNLRDQHDIECGLDDGNKGFASLLGDGEENLYE